MFRRKNIISSLLNVLGMSVAFAALYVILVQVHHDFSYNKSIRDHERIYLVTMPSWYDEGRYMTHLNRQYPYLLMASVPEVEAGGVISSGFNHNIETEVFLAPDEAGMADKFAGTSELCQITSGLIEVMGLEFVKGRVEDFIPGGGHVAISESEAERFGLDVGSRFFLRYLGSSKLQFEVTAIFKDMPKNSLCESFRMLWNIGEEGMYDSTQWSYVHFFKLSEGSLAHEVEDKFDDIYYEMFKSKYPEVDEVEIQDAMQDVDIHLVPLADTYFDKTLEYDGEQGNKVTTLTLLGVVILLVIIAFINYFNFFMATVPVRMKSVNIRKIHGSSRAGIAGRFIAESLMMMMFSLCLSAVIILLFNESSFAELIDCNTAFNANYGVAAVTVLIALSISIVASLYPSLYITSFNPAMVVNGGFATSSGGRRLRYILIGLQFVISIGLIVCSMFISLQRNYMMKHDMGFDRENLLVADVSWNVANNYEESVTNALKGSPLVKDVTWANGSIVQVQRMGWGRTYKGNTINFQCYPVSWDFLRFMGIDIIEGRDFVQSDEQSENGVFIFNEKARDEFGLTLEDKVQGHMYETDIVGFCENFNFMPLQSGVEPFCFYVFGANPWRKNNTVFVRTNEGAAVGEAMNLIRKTVSEFDSETTFDEVDVEIYNEQLAKAYYKEQNLSKLIALFTLLAIVISLMGVWGLVMFETEYRQKEIGVRRVNGAAVCEILAMFNMKFIRIVVICAVIATPLSMYIMGLYLQGFAYHVPMYAWVFIVALLAVLAVTIAVVTARSWRASTKNPVEALRNE